MRRRAHLPGRPAPAWRLPVWRLPAGPGCGRGRGTRRRCGCRGRGRGSEPGRASAGEPSARRPPRAAAAEDDVGREAAGGGRRGFRGRLGAAAHAHAAGGDRRLEPQHPGLEVARDHRQVQHLAGRHGDVGRIEVVVPPLQVNDLGGVVARDDRGVVEVVRPSHDHRRDAARAAADHDVGQHRDAVLVGLGMLGGLLDVHLEGVGVAVDVDHAPRHVRNASHLDPLAPMPDSPRAPSPSNSRSAVRGTAYEQAPHRTRARRATC